MENLLEIDIDNKYDLIDKYNEKKLSNELLKYIINQTIFTKKNKKIKIVINKKININEDSVEMIREGLKKEYTKSLEERNRNNVKQCILLMLGMIFIFIATRIENRGMWREIIFYRLGTDMENGKNRIVFRCIWSKKKKDYKKIVDK